MARQEADVEYLANVHWIFFHITIAKLGCASKFRQVVGYLKVDDRRVCVAEPRILV